MRVGHAPADRKPQAGAGGLGGHEGIEQRATAPFGEISHTHGHLATWFHCLNDI
jgi:hypothetical protein